MVAHHVVPQGDPPGVVVGDFPQVLLAEQHCDVVADLVQHPDHLVVPEILPLVRREGGEGVLVLQYPDVVPGPVEQEPPRQQAGFCLLYTSRCV